MGQRKLDRKMLILEPKGKTYMAEEIVVIEQVRMLDPVDMALKSHLQLQ